MGEFRVMYLKGFAIWVDLSRQRANCIQTQTRCFAWDLKIGGLSELMILKPILIKKFFVC